MTTTSSTSSTSSSALQALGLGSGLDIDALVTALTNSEMSAANNRIERQQDAVTTQVSAVASMKSALAVFQASLLGLTTSSSARSATSSDTTLLTASAGSKAAVGNYKVIVDHLATAHQLLSTNFSDGAATVVGTGDLTLSMGGKSFSVTIDSSNNTLSGIRDAINKASGSSGISATLVYGTSGAQLMLSSSKTGAGNEIEVTASGGDGGLNQLTYGTGNTTHYTENQGAQDALIYVAGVAHTSSTNKVTDAIDGITLNLVKGAPTTEVTVRIANDTSSVTNLVKSLVTAYNTLNGQLSSLGSYNASTQTAGALLGDALYNNVQRQLSHALRDSVSGVQSIYNSLSSLGVTTDAKGNLTVNDSKLSTALSDDFQAVTTVLQSSNGMVARLSSFLDDALASNGLIAARDASLDRQQDAIDKQKDLVEMRTQQVQARYLAKFNAMDSLLATMHNTANYLTQTFDALTRDTK